jgi:hypothetical protein
MRGARKALAVVPAPAADELDVQATATAVPGASDSGGRNRLLGRARRPTLVGVALIAGLTALAVALGVVLSGRPLTLAGSNSVPANLAVSFITHAESSCEEGGTVPQGTRAIRVSLSANTGPEVTLKVFSGSTLVTEGEHDAGWGIDETVTVPVKRVAHTVHEAHVCTSVTNVVEPLQVNGSRARASGGAIAVLLRMEYLRPGRRSWLSLAPSAARAMGLDHAPRGAWGAYLVIALMLTVAVLASRLIVREATPHAAARHRPSTRSGRSPALLDRLRRVLQRVPRAAWTCALVAFLSAACWTLITPPFQAPDEPSHFAYAQLLAETGRLPDSSSGAVSKEEVTVMEGLHQRAIEWHPEVGVFTSAAAQQELREDLEAPLDRVGPGGAGVAASEPPAYYALASIPYDLGSGGTLLDSLELMRLLSALMAGLTALFVFLFVRECLPGSPWAWTVGGLGAAITPLLGFTSGAVTPEAMLYAVAAAIFYCLARTFRRGLTPRRAVMLGFLVAVGFLTKLNFIGLAPGVILALVILGFRGERTGPEGERPRRAFGSVAIAIAIGFIPVCVYVASNLLEHHAALGLLSGGAQKTSAAGSLVTDLSYLWEFYLPHLPGMVNHFPGLSSFRQLWFDRSVGFYGWLDTSFPVWVENLALIPAALIAVLALRTVIERRAAVRAHLPEILVYLLMSLGLMALVGESFYQNRTFEGTGWAQPRYMVPLLALGAVLLAAAARGAGRRWGPALGALIVVLFLAQDVFSQLLVVARFYV